MKKGLPNLNMAGEKTMGISKDYKHEMQKDLTKEKLKEFEEIISQPCAYCGEIGENGIDRVNNKKGYTKDNCVSCCKVCNMMKWTLDANDFIKKCKDITIYSS